jgi:hypothetical protein
LGKRDELVGGGLKRYLVLSGPTDYQACDETILGSGDFVEQLWQETELPVVMPTSVQLEELIRQVVDVFDIDEGALRFYSASAIRSSHLLHWPFPRMTSPKPLRGLDPLLVVMLLLGKVIDSLGKTMNLLLTCFSRSRTSIGQLLITLPS